MSLNDVLTNWSMYEAVTRAMFTSINDPVRMAGIVANIGRFPAKQPAKWGTWLSAAAMLHALDEAVQVTDAALRQENAFIVATNEIAAAVTLPAPTQGQVADLVTQLNVVNNRIKQDQRFAAALGIGMALAGQIEQRLKA